MRGSGHTLVECLAVITVAAVLLAIATYGLRQAREKARTADTLASLRSASSEFEQWSADHDMDWLHANTLRPPHIEHFYAPSGAYLGSASHLDVRTAWPLVIDASNFASSRVRRAPSRRPIVYTQALLLDHRAFSECLGVLAPQWPRFFRAVSSAAVAFPSSKVALFEEPPALTVRPSRATPEPATKLTALVSLCDGSAREVRRTDVRVSSQNSCEAGLSDWHGWTPFEWTVDGYMGRDL